MKRHFSKQSLLRTMMIVATLLFMMPAQNAWADNVATATVDGNTYTYSSLEAAVSAANGAQSTATVTLLKDITEQPCSLEVRKPMIIDLNNHRINTTSDNPFFIYLSNGQQMTIKNGSVRGKRQAFYLWSGEAVLENITAEAPSLGSDCVRVCSGCSLTVSKSITFDASIDNQGFVKIADGQTLYDNEGNIYSGSYYRQDAKVLNNKTLSSLVTVTANGITDTYNSLESAVSAATYAYIKYGTAATVKLNHDITQQTCSLEVKKPMIIDLNNHRINSTANFSLFYIYLSNGQQMTIKNGSIRGTEYDVYIYEGEAVLENITAEAPSSGSNCVRVCNTCSLTVSKRITFDASIDNSGIVKIASGQTLYDKNGIDYYGNLNSSRVANLANNTLSSLVTVTANGTTTSYNSLQDAVSAANSAESAATITLNHDITAQTCSLEVRKPMIIDLNGHVVNADNLTYAYGIFSIMNAEGQVIIKNGTISRRGVNDYNGFAIYNYNSNVELENVTVKNTYSTDNPCLYNNGTLTISKNITLVGSIKNSGTVQIVDGQLLGDASGKYYLGTLTSAQVDALSNNTLSSLSVVASGSCGTGVKWALTGTSPNYTLTISGTGAMSTSPWYNYRADITTVVINNGVTGIDTEFMNTPNLTSVTIPASVTLICQQAFDGCTNLETVSGCEGVTDVGNDAFRDTKWLMDQPDGVVYIGKVAYLGKNVSGEVNIKAGTVSISSDAFKDCTNLTSITIPNSVTDIGSSAFEGCTSLTSITIPNGVKEIYEYTFQGCTSLTSITIPNGVTEIRDNAFYQTGLTSINIPNSVTHIGSSAFYGCTSLTSVTIPSSVESIGANAFFGCSILATVTIGSGVTSIGNNAFRECSKLETVTVYAPALPYPPTLGNDAFTDCDADLQIYVFSDYVNNYNDGNWSNYYNAGIIKGMTGGYCGADDPQTYEDESKNVIWVLSGTSPDYTLTISGTGAMLTNPWYSYKNDITTVVINEGVTGINMSVFMNTPNLTSVTIPASVSYIGQQVFDGCTNLETVSGCEGVTDVGNDAFSDTKWLTDQPDGVVYIGKVAYLGKNVSGEVNIKAGTVSISSDAFNDCTNLTSITIPNSVTDIGYSAFEGCTSLTSITIPNSVTFIDDSAFKGCTSLTSITIPNGVKEIYESTFQGCTSLTSVTIPSSLERIGEAAFYNSGLTSITIPNSVMYIGANAFRGCSNLETVTVYATTPPTLGNDAFNSCHEDLQIYVFSDLVDDYQSIWYQYCQIIKGMTGGYCGATDHETDVVWVLSGTSPNYTLTISGTGAMKDYGAPDAQPWKDYRSLITSVVIEDGVTSIGDFAFNGCSNLAIVYMQSSTPQITTWGTDAFANLVIAVPAAAYNSYYTALEGNSYQSMLRKNIATCSATVPNPIYHSSYTHSYFYDGTWNDNHGGIVVYDGETLLTYYHYDSEIEGFVGDYRFSMLESLDGGNCENLNEHCRVYLEGMGAYAGTLYKDVEIVPATVTNAKWGDLTWNLDASGNFTITGTGAMKSADTFRNYDWYNYSSYFTSITIGNGITTVASAAFGGNSNTNPYASVTSVSLPESLTTIGESAFAYCTGASFNADDLIAQGVTYGANSFNQVGCLVGTLANNADNTEKIALLYQARRANVTLSDRTLYKDGAWNTIVLPFDIADINAKEEEVYTCPLHGATVMELDVDNKWAMVNSEWAIDNEKGTSETGLVDGTLNLFFKPATSIESGKPYIIKWASGSNLENPLFNSVPVFVDNHNATSSDGKVVFKGTYGPVTWNTETKSILFLGDENKLYFPQPSGDDIPHLGAFRAYFELDPTAHVREFNLNFEDGTQTTGIIGHTDNTDNTDKADAAWYSLDGRKLDAKPSSKGIYIHGGRKVVIK